MRRLVLALALLLWPASAGAETITVSPDANDTIKPLQAAVSRAKAGDTIIVNDGTYRGTLSLSGVYGSANAPITIQSKNPLGATIIGPANGHTVSAWGVSNVTLQGFTLQGTYKGDADLNVVHIGGPFTRPATGVAIVGNRITGTANDGVKFMEGAKGNMILGNLFDGTWKEEAMDNVSVQDMVIANNTVKGRAGNSGLTYKAGSHSFEITGNLFDIDADVQISNGGYGDSRDTRWDRMSPQFKGGDEARDSTVTGNVINGNVRLVSATGITIEGNDLNGTVSNGRNVFWSGAIASHDNTVRNNTVTVADAGAGDLTTAIPDVPTAPVTPIAPTLPVDPGAQVAGDPTTPQAPPPQPDPGTVAVPPGLPPIPAVPTAPSPGKPQVVYPPPAQPPAPAPPSTVLTNISNAVVLSQASPLGPGVLNGIVETFTGQASLWRTTLQGLALDLFAVLAGIEIAWVVGRALARRVDFADLLEIAVMQVVTIGFFYWLLINSADFVLAIVASFGEAANRASTAGGGMTNLSPSDIFASGLNMGQIIWNGITISNPGLSTLLVLAGIINICIYAIIAAKLIEVLVEAAFVAYAGIIMMGFGGSAFTRDYAIAQFRYAISVGVKRFVLQLIVGLAQGIITGWATTVATAGAMNWTTIGILLGAPIVMWRLAEILPQRAQDMVMGVSTYSSGHLGHAATTVAATAGAVAAGLVGAGAAAKAAYQLSQAQIAQRGQTGGQTGGQSPGFAQRAAMTTGLMARNLGTAAAHDVGQRMVGRNRFGHASWRMAEDMKTQASATKKGGTP